MSTANFHVPCKLEISQILLGEENFSTDPHGELDGDQDAFFGMAKDILQRLKTRVCVVNNIETLNAIFIFSFV